MQNITIKITPPNRVDPSIPVTVQVRKASRGLFTVLLDGRRLTVVRESPAGWRPDTGYTTFATFEAAVSVGADQAIKMIRQDAAYAGQPDPFASLY